MPCHAGLQTNCERRQPTVLNVALALELANAAHTMTDQEFKPDRPVTHPFKDIASLEDADGREAASN